MLIDAHAHVGSCRVFGHNLEPATVLAMMDAHGVTTSIVQPFPGAPDPARVHDLIAELGRQHPGRIYGIASLSPHQDAEAYRTEVRRCVQDLGFVGLKIHPIGHAVNPLTPDARLPFEVATELNVPVMIHTGPGIPFAEPAMWIPLARAFPQTTVILAHAGWGLFTGPAILAGELCENVVLETSWCNVTDLARMAKVVGADRMLFGADMPLNVPVEVAKYQALGMSDTDLEQVLWRNSERLFRLTGLPQPAASTNEAPAHL
ncbi:MAG: amidohydrolase [Chloroflexi bacterium]|nr:amidohydrolase [Chloroflexota bacterium]